MKQPKTRFSLLLLLGLSFALPSVLVVSKVAAFKQGIHEDVTETVLINNGFDADSADVVGDSNYYTDVFEATSDAAHGDNNQLAAASARLRDKIRAIGDSLQACQRRTALDALGEALHTVQDIYSHSNSVDNGIPVSDLLNLENGTALCDPRNNFAPTGLVTGYFNLNGFLTGDQCRGIASGQCCHRDLNKDDSGESNGARHPAARTAATTATTTYLNLVETDIRNRFSSDQAALFLKQLKRKQRTLMFVIDDTGSMGDDIAGVKAAANSFLNQVVAGDEAPTLGLVSYKDSVINRGLTCDIERLRSQINSLAASGGGDCPEASNAALLSAILTFPIGRSDIQIDGGRIILATDASAGDAFLGPTVASSALFRGVSIDAILTGDCTAEELAAVPPATEAIIDPLTSRSARTQLRALTEQTGGVLFNVARVEVDEVVPILLDLGSPKTGVLLNRKVEFPTSGKVTVDVPIDDTLGERVTFLATSSSSAAPPMLSLTRPDGSEVKVTDSGVVAQTLSSVTRITVTNPPVGLWKVTLMGTGSAVLRVFGATPFQFTGLRLFDPAATLKRPEPDYLPLEGQPVAGAEIIAEIGFSAAPSEIMMALRRTDGSLLKTVPLAAATGTRHFLARFVVPNESFVIEVTGKTPGGKSFIRQINVPVTPRLVKISATPDSSTAPSGSKADIEVTVKNEAATAATFQLTATPSLPWPVTVPAEFTLAGGAAQTFIVSVSIPFDTAAGMRADITLIVTDTANPVNRNNTTVSVSSGTAAIPLEADVTPRPNGNGSVTVPDWVQTGNFFTRIDVPAPGSEFQRADCAPRTTKGDGFISIADWVQAGRYAAGLDPVVSAGGPTGLPSASLAPFSATAEGSSRQLRVVPTQFQRGQIGTLNLELDAQGNENAMAFTLNFDPKVMMFLDATLGDGARGATLSLNQTQIAQGRLGVALALSIGQSLTAGSLGMLKVRFVPLSGVGATNTVIGFDDQILRREIVDAEANTLSATSFSNATVEVAGRAAAHVVAANYAGPNVAADSIASAFGIDLATTTVGASAGELPTTLGGTRVLVKDANGVERRARLFFVSPGQVNYEIPAGTAEGYASVIITDARGISTAGFIQVTKVAPGIFSADASGKGWAAADVVYVKPDQSQVIRQVARFDVGQNRFVPVPIDLSTDAAVLVLYGTGVRHRAGLANVKVKIDGVEAAVEYADRQGQFAGLDQINVRLPKSLAGRGEVNVEVSVEGKPANTIRIMLQ